MAQTVRDQQVEFEKTKGPVVYKSKVSDFYCSFMQKEGGGAVGPASERLLVEALAFLEAFETEVADLPTAELFEVLPTLEAAFEAMADLPGRCELLEAVAFLAPVDERPTFVLRLAAEGHGFSLVPL